jgi:hypothetical protein
VVEVEARAVAVVGIAWLRYVECKITSVVGFQMRLVRGAKLEIVCIVLVPRLQPCRSYPGERR